MQNSSFNIYSEFTLTLHFRSEHSTAAQSFGPPCTRRRYIIVDLEAELRRQTRRHGETPAAKRPRFRSSCRSCMGISHPYAHEVLLVRRHRRPTRGDGRPGSSGSSSSPSSSNNPPPPSPNPITPPPPPNPPGTPPRPKPPPAPPPPPAPAAPPPLAHFLDAAHGGGSSG